MMIIKRVFNRNAFIYTHNAGNDVLVLRCLSSKNDCDNPTPQTEGKTVQEWPARSPPPWHNDCGEIKPVNYDPYKIKTPNIVVPPMPPSTAQERQIDEDHSLFHTPIVNLGDAPNAKQYYNTAIMHPDYWKDLKSQPKCEEDYPKTRLGYHGSVKYKFAFHEPWKPLDRVTLMSMSEKEELPKDDLPKEEASKEEGDGTEGKQLKQIDA